MQLTLRCTNVALHPNATQSVTLQEPPREFLPVRMGENRPAPGSNLIITGTSRIPAPPVRGPVSVLLTNISTDQKFEQGKEYTLSIS